MWDWIWSKTPDGGFFGVFFSTSLVRRWGKQTWQEMEHDLVN
jgi:hypothetical protein